MLSPTPEAVQPIPTWFDDDECLSGIAAKDIRAAIAVARLMQRHWRHHGRWPLYRSLCRQCRQRVTERTYVQLRQRLDGLVAESLESFVIEPLPFEGRLTRSDLAARADAYAAQYEAWRLLHGIRSIDDAQRRGSDRRPVVCLSTRQSFASVCDAAKWLQSQGKLRVQASHIRTAIAAGRQLAKLRWAYADALGAEEVRCAV